MILDTNALVSGIFFGGVPRYPDGHQYFATILDVLALHSPILNAQPLSAPVCADPDDDKFLAVAVRQCAPSRS